MTTESVHRSNPPINAKDFGVPAEFAERAENYTQWAIAAERTRACRIVTGLCISDNNAREICEAIRAQGQRTTQFCAVAEQARQEEREACAIAGGAAADAGRDVAAAIRARGQA